MKKEGLYPRICICFDGVTAKSNYRKILRSLLDYFKEIKSDYKPEDVSPFKRSFASYSIPKGYVDKKKFGYEWIIGLYNAKENFEKSIGWLEELKSKTKGEKKKKKIETYLKYHIEYLKQSRPLEKKCKIRCEIKINALKKFPQKPFKTGGFLEKFRTLNKILSILNGFDIKIEGHTCNYLLFDGKKYIAKNLEKVPIETFIDKKDRNKVGKERIDMYACWFENSPNGLRRVILSEEEGDYRFYSAIRYEANSLSDLLKQSYLRSLKMADLFIEKRKGGK